jgi:membrane fusion protein, multidrug efflux system
MSVFAGKFLPPFIAAEGDRGARARRVAIRLGAFLAALAGLGAAYLFLPRELARAPAPPQAGRGAPVAVTAAEAARGDFPVIYSGLGTVVASATSVVKAQVSGPLIDVNSYEGQAVKAGDLLARIDPRPFEFAEAQSEGQLQKDAALLANAERDLARYEALNRKVKDAISRQQLDTQASLISQYKAAVAVDRAQLGQARLNLNYCRIVAPIDGRVGLRLVDPGNIVQTNDPTGVAVITRVSPITVIFTLPEVQLQSVLKRFRAGETLTVLAYDHERAARDHSAEIARGRLYAIDNQIDATSGTVKLRAEFANDDERLYPNQFVNAELHLATLKEATLAPAPAVQPGAKGPFVYVIGADDTVAARPVRLGPTDGDRVVIESGLEAGERVVIEGVDRLRDGAKIALSARGDAKRESGKPKSENGADDRKRSPADGRQKTAAPASVP